MSAGRRKVWMVSVFYLVLTSNHVGTRAERPVDFNREIRPILSGKCFHCHGPDPESRQAGLRLDLEHTAKEIRSGVAAISAGEPEQSELIRRIETVDVSEQMPPPEVGKGLRTAERQLLRRWVAEGARWSAAWAYERPIKTTPPEVDDLEWCRNWIDQYILRRLQQEGLHPSAEADDVTLLRRLSFDLTGLPPSREEVEDFLADGSDQAYERAVDRLLSSPRFGERMAMYWLDLVRYADTVGYHGDQNHHASPYRDWVVNAFNRNLPFDEFTRAQLAGDFLPGDDKDNLIASGYNRLLQTNHEGGVQPKEYIAIYAADRIRNFSSVWLAATMGCCQCHDHKYDPLTTREFYSLSAFFADIDDTHHLTHIVNREFTKRLPEIVVLSEDEQSRIDELKGRKETLNERLKQAVERNGGPDLIELLEKEANDLDKKIVSIERSARKMMVTKQTTPRVTRILPRGNWLDETGEVVEPQTPAVLGDLEVGGRRANRLDLAHWLCDVEAGTGGLTARVTANRLWFLMFGSGLARNLEDFGAQGDAPTHPLLLDALAIEFIDSDWNIKHLLKVIVTSSTYRQSSRITDELRIRDPANLWLARQARFRLPAETIRDNALAIGGLLQHEIGGPSIKPYQPKGHYRHLNFPKRVYRPHRDYRQWRRGVYMHWQRQFLHPMLAAFDAPNREQCTAQRPKSNTPLASLTLMNDPTFVEAARGLATRILGIEDLNDDERIDTAFWLATSRSPDLQEQDELRESLAVFRRFFQDHANESEALLSVGLTPVDERLSHAELAAWTGLSRVILNLCETNSRN